VTHERFGEGVILDIEGSGDKAEAIVRSRGLPEPHVKKELYWPKGKGAGQPVDVTTGERVHGRAAEVASQA
jgi:hypothetical protein